MPLAPGPSAALEAIEQTRERRPPMAEAAMHVIDRAGRAERQISEHVRLRLREAQVAERPVDPERHRVGGALERRHDEGRVQFIHTRAYYTPAYCSRQVPTHVR